MDGKEQFRSLIFCISSQAARAALAVAVVFALTVGLARLAQAQTETVLYSFAGPTDGDLPYAGLIFDAAGNLYGTTEQGGTANHGTVFEIIP